MLSKEYPSKSNSFSAVPTPSCCKKKQNFDLFIKENYVKAYVCRKGRKDQPVSEMHWQDPPDHIGQRRGY